MRSDHQLCVATGRAVIVHKSGDFMSRRLGAKRRKVTLAEAPLTTDRSGPVDRRARDLLRNAHVVAVEVDDPYALESGEKIVAFRSLRDDPLARLHCRKMISDVQHEAGKDYRRDMELVEIGGARAIDPTKEAVDGGRFIAEPISAAYGKAHKRLGEAGVAMGLLQESIVRAVLAGNLFPGQVAVVRGFRSEKDQGHYAWLFRKALDVLAVFYGHSNEPLPKK